MLLWLPQRLLSSPATHRQHAVTATATSDSRQSRSDAPRRQQLRKPPGQQRQSDSGGGGAGSSSGWCEVESAPAWRVFGVSVPAEEDPGKDDYTTVHFQLLAALARKLRVRGGTSLPAAAVRVVRKSFDARKARDGAPAR